MLPVGRIETKVAASLRVPGVQGVIVRREIISILSNPVQCVLIVTAPIVIITSADFQWRPSELLPLGLCAIGAVVKTATFSSLY